MAKKEKKEDLQSALFYSVERGVVSTPKFNEYWKNGNAWVSCGIDNLYCNELLRLFLDSSSLHTSIIRKKANMTAGNGFKTEGLGGPALNFLANRFGTMTIDEIAFATSFDFSIFGGFYLQITWSKDGKTIARIEHVPYEKVRVSKPLPIPTDDGKYYYISKDWEFYRRVENTPIKVCGWNPLKSKEEPNQILFVKQYSPGAEYYSYPNYTSSLNFIKLAYEIGVFHLKSLQSNLNSGLIIINKSGIPSAEMREQQYQEIKRRYAGADAAGDILMVYAENAEKAPEFIPMPNNASDTRFNILIEQVNQNILIGHDASSIVGNIQTAGKLGNRTEIQDSYEMFQNTVIEPGQKVIENVINKLAGYNGIITDLKLNKYNTYTSVPVDQKMMLEIKKQD